MSDKKISQLTAATTPLAGTEVVPVVQSGVTKKVPIGDLTAGRDVAVNKLTAADNIVIGTSGKGIDFSATPDGAGTMTSELLADYEEGTFTPAIYGSSTAGAGTYSAQTGRYTKIGNRVFFDIYIVWSAHTGTGVMRISGLPYTVASAISSTASAVYNNVALTASNYAQPLINQNSTNVFLYQYPVGGGTTTETAIDTAGTLWISGQYSV